MQDGEDDVRAVSNETLLPALSLVAQHEGQVAFDIQGALLQFLLGFCKLSLSKGLEERVCMCCVGRRG